MYFLTVDIESLQKNFSRAKLILLFFIIGKSSIGFLLNNLLRFSFIAFAKNPHKQIIWNHFEIDYIIVALLKH